VAAFGFTPTVDDCASCHAEIPPDDAALFEMRAGGVLCRNCAASAPGRRLLPATARDAIRAWLTGDLCTLSDASTRKAHRRLLREFLAEHLSDGRTLSAFAAWEAQCDRNGA
jgi:recombinational DNA repair protein (RecF pathway)